MTALPEERRAELAQALPDALHAADDLGDEATADDVFRAVADALAPMLAGWLAAERERADRLEAMCDRLAGRLAVLPDLWREEGRAVMFNRPGDDLTPQARVGKWLHEKTRVIPPADPTAETR